MSVIQRDIDSINELGNKFFELTNLESEADQHICRFLSKSKHMYEAIEYHLNKPEKVYRNEYRNYHILTLKIYHNRLKGTVSK
jgi:hypothetical protein